MFALLHFQRNISHFFLRFIFAFYCDRTDQIWQEAKWEREEGMVGKGPRVGIWTRDAQSATALHIGELPTKLSVPTTSFTILIIFFPEDHPQND